jgi:sugar lactone lactonase YvrE
MFAALACAAFVTVAWAATPAAAWDRGNVETFAVLPAGATGPEGIAVGSDGNVYVATFGFNSAGPVDGAGKVYVFNSSGVLLRTLTIAGSTSHLLGLDFHPNTHALLVIDFGAQQVLSVDPQTGASSVFVNVGANAGLNALTFDRAGNVYISDSFQGKIWKTNPRGGNLTVWASDAATLGTTGVPPFGANGLGFNKAGNALFVANTGNDTVVRIPVLNTGQAGTPQVFVNSINGADGLILDKDDNIWVAANQADEIVVLDPTGKAIAKLGDFNGVKTGVAQGLLFPASPVFSKDRHSVYVTNLALDIRLFGLAQSVDSQWTAQVQRYTVSKIKAQIPPIP